MFNDLVCTCCGKSVHFSRAEKMRDTFICPYCSGTLVKNNSKEAFSKTLLGLLEGRKVNDKRNSKVGKNKEL